jgi:peroxiredoxin Q/BCP
MARTRAPAAGDPAPDFDLPAHTGGTVRLSDLRGRPVVLYVMREFT